MASFKRPTLSTPPWYAVLPAPLAGAFAHVGPLSHARHDGVRRVLPLADVEVQWSRRVWLPALLMTRRYRDAHHVACLPDAPGPALRITIRELSSSLSEREAPMISDQLGLYACSTGWGSLRPHHGESCVRTRVCCRSSFEPLSHARSTDTLAVRSRARVCEL